MPRPNSSLPETLRAITFYEGRGVDFNLLLNETSFSEVTLRTNLKRLLEESKITVDRNTKPYTYHLKPQEGA